MTEDSTEMKRLGYKKSEDGNDSGGSPGACKKDQWVSDRKKSRIDWRTSRSDRKAQWRANDFKEIDDDLVIKPYELIDLIDQIQRALQEADD